LNRLFTYLARFAAIVFGFFCASLAASAFLHLLFFGMAGLAGEVAGGPLAAPVFAGVPFVALFIGYLAFFPALLFIAVAEALARRDWLYYALSGGGVALVIVGAALVAGGEGAAFPALSFVGAGLVGGIAYWLAAGRRAGAWLHGPSGRTPSGS
jgi:hypothetical protein